MLFNIPDIQASFRTLVGWRQQQDPSAAAVKLTALTTSDSGIYMQGVHPMLTLANLQSICPDFTLYVYPAWSSGTAYAVGDKVVLSSVTYRCKLAHTNQTPPNTTYWEVWNKDKAFTEWLEQDMDGAAALFLNDWIGRKFAGQSARNIVEREQLYTATGSNNEKIANPGDKMAGIELRVTRSRGARAWLNKISLHLDTAQPLTVYLYKYGNKNPVESISLEYTSAGDVQWFDLGWELKGEGAYYLCYSLNELSGQAYNDGNERTAWSAGWQLPGSRYIKAQPFNADIVDVGGVGADEIENTLIVGGTEVFLTSKISYHEDTNGLNLQFHVGCSYTDLVIEQRKNFATAFSLFWAKHLLHLLSYNPNARVNRQEANVNREDVMYELNGVAMNNSFSLHKQYEQAVEAILLDQTGLDKVCLPCKRKGKISIGVI